MVPGGVDAVADGALMDALILPAIRDGGALAAVRRLFGGSERSITIHPVWVRDYVREQAKLDRLGRQAEAGAVTLRVARTFAPEQAADADRLLEAGGTRGRLVIEFELRSGWTDLPGAAPGAAHQGGGLASWRVRRRRVRGHNDRNRDPAGTRAGRHRTARVGRARPSVLEVVPERSARDS